MIKRTSDIWDLQKNDKWYTASWQFTKLLKKDSISAINKYM